MEYELLLMSQGRRHGSDSATIGSAEPPSTTVVEAVAAATETDPNELEPLYSAVDPDALDALFADTGTRRAAGHIEFTYCGFAVVVSRDDSGTNVAVY
jgi:hypothetical protein